MDLNLTLSCFAQRHTPDQGGINIKFPIGVQPRSDYSEYSIPIDTYENSTEMDDLLIPGVSGCTELIVSPNNITMKVQQAVSFTMEKCASPQTIPKNIPQMMQQASLPYQEPLFPLHSVNPYTLDYTNEAYLNKLNQDFASHQILNKVKDMVVQSKLDPCSPPFIFNPEQKMHQLNPEAKEYIPQCMRDSPASSGAEENLISQSPLFNGEENLNSQSLLLNREENLNSQSPLLNGEEYLNSQSHLLNGEENLNSQSSLLNGKDFPDAKMKTESFASLINPPGTSVGPPNDMSDDNDDDSFLVEFDRQSINSTDDLSGDESDSSSTTEDSSLCCHPRKHRTFSESSIESNDSFLVEFEDCNDEEQEDCLDCSGSSGPIYSKCKAIIGNLFSQSSDDEEHCDGESKKCEVDDFFALRYDDAWDLPCRLDINNITSTSESNTKKKQFKDSINSSEENEIDVSESLNNFKLINKRWNAEVQRECKNTTPSKVKFSDCIKIHPMIAWKFAYQAARNGKWIEAARDRARFKLRIERTAEALNRIFDPEHRSRMFSMIYPDAEIT